MKLSRTTKGSNISRADRPAVIIASAEQLFSYSIYQSRWGLLRSPHGGPLEATTQESVFSALAQTNWFAPLLPELQSGTMAAMARLAQDPELRDKIRSNLAQQNLFVSDGLAKSVIPPKTYDEARSAPGAIALPSSQYAVNGIRN